MIVSIIVGIIAGAIASKAMHQEGQGWIVNLLIGLVGGFVGGNVLGWFGIHWEGLIGQIVTASLGAFIFLWVLVKLKVLGKNKGESSH